MLKHSSDPYIVHMVMAILLEHKFTGIMKVATLKFYLLLYNCVNCITNHGVKQPGSIACVGVDYSMIKFGQVIVCTDGMAWSVPS